MSGYWGKKAIAEARRYCKVNVAASSEDTKFSCVPRRDQWKLDPKAAYVHITSNETIEGVEFHWTPDTGAVPLVTDASSHILSRPMDVGRYGLIYAGAQKNVGPAGLTIVIVREDLIGQAIPATPSVFDYKVQAGADSMHNTPATFALYVSGLVFQWLKQLGGLRKMEEINIAKAKVLYDYLDQTEFYHAPVVKDDRSRMNVQFRLRGAELDAEFLKQAERRGLTQLKGHRAIGGMRASIYNAMPIEGVKALVEHMREFERTHG
jgi:phosphoserine aminotransferase